MTFLHMARFQKSGKSRAKAALWHLDVVFGSVLAAKHRGYGSVNLEVQILWQAQHFVNFKVKTSWQALHFVTLCTSTLSISRPLDRTLCYLTRALRCVF